MSGEEEDVAASQLTVTMDVLQDQGWAAGDEPTTALNCPAQGSAASP